MEEKIREHMDYLFSSAPKTRKAMELQEEMTQNTIEKYQDLLGEGYSEEGAFQNVIHSIGDVTELFQDLEEQNLLTLPEADRKKKAMLNAVSAGMFIFAGVIFLAGILIQPVSPYHTIGWIPGSRIDYTMLGLILAIIMCIAPTCMVVYAANMYPSYRKRESSLVESYKEARYVCNKHKAVKRSISAIIWTIVLFFYFVISFVTMSWYITWVIFLIGGCIQAVTELLFNLKEK